MSVRLLQRALLALWLTGAVDAVAQSAGERIVVPLGDPSRPARLDVSLVSGEIVVKGYDGNEVIIVAGNRADEDPDDDADDERRSNRRSDARAQARSDRDEEEDARRAGLRRIPTASMGLTAAERDNTVTVRADLGSRRLSLEISVPSRTSVHAATVNGGGIAVSGVVGEHELSNVNGDVHATDIGGAAVVNTTNGEVRVSFTEVASGKAMSFSSFNGDVDVAFPANLAADWRINTGHGDFLTDFDVAVQPSAAVVERDGGRDRYEVRVRRETRALVGGGGPEMQFQTFNGDVMIRKR